MTRRFVVSLPATVHGQHSPTVFSEVYLHLLCYVSVFVCTVSVSGVCVCGGGDGRGACVHTVCVCVVSAVCMSVQSVFMHAEKLLCVPDIANYRVILHQVVTTWQSREFKLIKDPVMYSMWLHDTLLCTFVISTLVASLHSQHA